MHNLLYTQRVCPSLSFLALIFLGQTHFPSNGSQAPLTHVRFLAEHRLLETRPASATSER